MVVALLQPLQLRPGLVVLRVAVVLLLHVLDELPGEVRPELALVAHAPEEIEGGIPLGSIQGILIRTKEGRPISDITDYQLNFFPGKIFHHHSAVLLGIFHHQGCFPEKIFHSQHQPSQPSRKNT